MSIVKREEQLPAVQPTILEIIARAASDPNVDVSKMRELMAMQKEIVAEERRMVYVEAMRNAQNALPQFVKSARVVVKGIERSRFAPIEDIDAVLRPICFDNGFTIDDDVKTIDAKNVLVICKVSHKEGHFVEKTLPVPIDFSEYRSGSQSTVASVTLAKRHLRKMHFNIVEKGEDSDGEPTETISAEQALDLNTQIQDAGGKLPGFLNHFKISALTELRIVDMPEAMQMIASKRASK